MKIGIISDVHSNIEALEETFKAFMKEKVEKVICIGDVIGIGSYPEKCIDYLIKNQEMILTFVRGNHENYLLNGLPKKNHNAENAKPMTDEELSTHYWNHSRINEKELEFLKNLKYRDKIEIEGKKIVVEHYPMDRSNVFKQFKKYSSEIEIVDLFEDKAADVYLFGHTHQRYYYENEGKYYINPGSLGCPAGTENAYAGILEINKENIEYKQIEVEYDVQNVIKEIRDLNYPLNEFMINTFYI